MVKIKVLKDNVYQPDSFLTGKKASDVALDMYCSRFTKMSKGLGNLRPDFGLMC